MFLMKIPKALLTTVLLGTALSEPFTLPSSLHEIGEYAFSEDASIRSVTIPDSVIRIGEGAFCGCRELETAWIPSNVTYIGEDAFAGCTDDLLIRTNADSTASSYARAHNIAYRADTVYRALLIGNTYAHDEELRLYGPENDVPAMSSCISLFQGTAYHITARMNQTAEMICDDIAEVFAGAGAQDVSLFYYSGHGIIDYGRAALLGNDDIGYITADDLRAELDRIPGRKIVILDTCYSGDFIASSVSEEGSSGVSASPDSHSAEDFVRQFTLAFSKRKRGGLAADGFFVLTAAAPGEECFEYNFGGKYMGDFTECFAEGCGWDPIEDTEMQTGADDNLNGVVTFREMYDYISLILQNAPQHVMIWPESSNWFGFLRRIPVR